MSNCSARHAMRFAMHSHLGMEQFMQLHREGTIEAPASSPVLALRLSVICGLTGCGLLVTLRSPGMVLYGSCTATCRASGCCGLQQVGDSGSPYSSACSQMQPACSRAQQIPTAAHATRWALAVPNRQGSIHSRSQWHPSAVTAAATAAAAAVAALGRLVKPWSSSGCL